MRKTFILFLLMIATWVAPAAEMTNGSFYINTPIVCNLTYLDGRMATNQLRSEYTYKIDNAIWDFESITNTTMYLANGPIVTVRTNSSFEITSFEYVITNSMSNSHRALFGRHNTTLMLKRGEFAVTYPSFDDESFFGIMTPHSSYQLLNGKFVFSITTNSTTVYVLEGKMNIQNSKKEISNKNRSMTTHVTQMDQSDGTNNIPIEIDNVQFFMIDGVPQGIFLK